jgi:hypothetical protein
MLGFKLNSVQRGLDAKPATMECSQLLREGHLHCYQRDGKDAAVMLNTAVKIGLILILILLTASNVTLTMDEGDFTYCYKQVKKADVTCNTMQLNQDRFKLISDFLRFLDSGMIKNEK